MTDAAPAKKVLGQHWLHDKVSLRAIVKAANIQAGDVVLEIGSGQGSLTDELLRAKAKVIALEYDTELITHLHNKYDTRPSTEIIIQEGDIRRFDLNKMPPGYKIVANIPYYLTANVLRMLTETDHKPAVAVILVQKEVAERVAAKPGYMSALSAIVQLYYLVSLGLVVPSGMFTPSPKVDSQLLVLQWRPRPLFKDVSQRQFIQLIKLGFAQPRKTLANNLRAGFVLSKEDSEALINAAGLTTSVRAQALSLQDWYKLYLAIASSVKSRSGQT